MFNSDYKIHHKIPDAWEPIVYSKKIDDVAHDNVIFTQIFNHDYEGELKGIGSKLVIRSWPDLKANSYVVGTPINPKRVTATAREVTVGRAWELSLVLDQWELMNSDMKAWERMRSQKIGVAASEFQEDEWFGEAAAALKATDQKDWNSGNQAGINGDIRLGEINAPVVLVSDKKPTADGQKNVLAHFYDIDMVHSRHRGASSASRKYIITVPEVGKVLREFDAFERSACNDSLQELLRKDVMSVGRLGVTGFDVYLSNRMRPVAKTDDGKSVYPIYFGDERAWTYADLFSETGVKEDPVTPGVQYEYHIGGYDWWLADPQYFGVSYVAI